MAVARSISLDRAVRAVGKVRERLSKAVLALEAAKIPYAVAGDSAVAAWVSTIDEAAVRNTRDVDMLVDRADLERIRQALEAVGFVYWRVAGIDVFLDGPDSSVRDAVHLIFAGEMVRDHELLPNPKVNDSEQADNFRVLSLEALVRIKLTAFRDKDRTHLRDMLDVGLIDQSWTEKVPPELAERLQSLIDDPNG
jgi:hypothetical protein